MNPVFEDVFLGPMASSSFSQGLRFRYFSTLKRVVKGQCSCRLPERKETHQTRKGQVKVQ